MVKVSISGIDANSHAFRAAMEALWEEQQAIFQSRLREAAEAVAKLKTGEKLLFEVPKLSIEVEGA